MHISARMQPHQRLRVRSNLSFIPTVFYQLYKNAVVKALAYVGRNY